MELENCSNRPKGRKSLYAMRPVAVSCNCQGILQHPSHRFWWKLRVALSCQNRQHLSMLLSEGLSSDLTHAWVFTPHCPDSSLPDLNTRQDIPLPTHTDSIWILGQSCLMPWSVTWLWRFFGFMFVCAMVILHKSTFSLCMCYGEGRCNVLSFTQSNGPLVCIIEWTLRSELEMLFCFLNKVLLLWELCSLHSLRQPVYCLHSPWMT